MMNLPYVTAFYAALLALLGVVLTARVIIGRGTFAVTAGDGGHPVMAQRIRAHANFAEQVPLALLVIGFAEASGAPKLAIHIVAIVLIVARLFSAVALSGSLADTTGRRIGAGVTALTIAAASAMILLRMASVI